MRLTYSFLFIFLILGFSTGVNAQKNFASGSWNTFPDEFHTGNPNGSISINSLGEPRWVHSVGFFLNNLKKIYTGCAPSETSIANYSSFTLALTVECANTDTVNTFNLTAVSLGVPHYLLGVNTHVKSLKNNSDIDINCFYSRDCLLSTYNSYLRKSSLRTVIEDDLFVGSATNSNISIEEVRFTNETLEVLLLFNELEDSYSGTLHAPGSENTFFIRDASGNRYNLIAQYGWKGDDKYGFGSYTIDADTEQHVVLFFEPVKNPQSVNNLSLLEGSCESGCWNFYDVRLKDQN